MNYPILRPFRRRYTPCPFSAFDASPLRRGRPFSSGTWFTILAIHRQHFMEPPMEDRGGDWERCSCKWYDAHFMIADGYTRDDGRETKTSLRNLTTSDELRRRKGRAMSMMKNRDVLSFGFDEYLVVPMELRAERMRGTRTTTSASWNLTNGKMKRMQCCFATMRTMRNLKMFAGESI